MALEHARTKTPRCPKFRRFARARCFANMPTKISRHNTHNCCRIAIECDFSTDDSWVGTVAPLPKSVTNHDDAGRTLRCILLGKAATDDWAHPQNGKQVGCSKLGWNLFRRSLPSRLTSVIEKCSHVGKHGVLFLPVGEITYIDRVLIVFRLFLPYNYYLIGIL